MFGGQRTQHSHEFFFDRISFCTVTCVNNFPVCLSFDKSLCGKTETTGTVSLSNEITTTITSCVDYANSQGGVPAAVTDPADVPSPLCTKVNPASGNGIIQFENCEVTMGGTACKSCKICQGGFAISFDCTNVDLQPSNPNLFVPGPDYKALCLDVSLLQNDAASP